MTDLTLATPCDLAHDCGNEAEPDSALCRSCAAVVLEEAADEMSNDVRRGR